MTLVSLIDCGNEATEEMQLLVTNPKGFLEILFSSFFLSTITTVGRIRPLHAGSWLNSSARGLQLLCIIIVILVVLNLFDQYLLSRKLNVHAPACVRVCVCVCHMSG